MSVAREVISRTSLILNLGKIRIAVLVSLSAVSGYILAGGRIDLEILFPLAGVLLLALGSGALNQYQERHMDAVMPRTAGRPIPGGDISARTGLMIALVLMTVGAVILWWGTNMIALLLGIFTAFWYNAVYTPLKRFSALAVIPGALIGALPPLIGWATVDPHLISPRPLALAVFFFIWQIPHFWLLLLNFGQDYVKAGYPSLTSILDHHRLGRITFIWIVATAMAIVLMPLFGFANLRIIYILLFLASLLLIWKSGNLLKSQKSGTTYRSAFIRINVYILVVMILLTVDRLLTT